KYQSTRSVYFWVKQLLLQLLYHNPAFMCAFSTERNRAKVFSFEHKSAIIILLVHCKPPVIAYAKHLRASSSVGQSWRLITVGTYHLRTRKKVGFPHFSPAQALQKVFSPTFHLRDLCKSS